jgi:opacity protein-like surface antigen
MSRTGVIFITFLTTTTVAMAADLQPYKAPVSVPVLPSWTGFYIGGHGGFATGDWGFDLDSKSVHALQYNQTFAGRDTSLSTSGGFGGLQVGVNYQLGRAVLGLEADVSFANLSSEQTYNTAPTFAPAFNACAYGPNTGCTDWKVGQKLEMFGTVRARAGVAMNTLLLYGTGGLAWARTKTTYDATDAMPNAPFEMFRLTGETSHLGWAAGGGAEWMFAPNWTLKVEYIYINLDNADIALSGVTRPGGTIPWNDLISTDLQLHTIRGGVNFKF